MAITATNTLETALQLASYGVPVFPLAANTTVPLKGSNGYKDATTDKDQLERWFSGRRSTSLNIGMALRPANLLVIDLDRNHSSGFNGVQSLAKLAKHYDNLPTDSYIMTTPHGGVHWFLKYPHGYDIPNKALADISPALAEYTGIDVVSYSTPAAGTLTKNGSYQVQQNGVTNPLDAAPCPQWLLTLLTTKTTTKLPHKRIRRETWAGNLIGELFYPDADTGNRNVYLTSLCGRLLSLSVRTDAAYQALQLANNNLPVPLPDKEVNQIFKSIVKKELSKVRSNDG